MQMIEPLFFDSHCHLDFAAFDVDRAAVWKACNAQGIRRLMIPGVSPSQWQNAARLCGQYDGFFYSVGIHPHWIEQQPWFDSAAGVGLPDTLQDELLGSIQNEFALVENPPGSRCLAIGECGLDNLIAVPSRVQEQLLMIHIELANRLRKPLIVHCVRAHNELIALLKRHQPGFGGVIHAFSGSYEMARQYVDLGFYLGVGGTITYARAQKTRATIANIPLSFLVLETDAPDMQVSGQQGLRNSPLSLVAIAQTLAELRGLPIEAIAHATWENTCRLFNCA
jgi:TatD DNase family protein